MKDPFPDMPGRGDSELAVAVRVARSAIAKLMPVCINPPAEFFEKPHVLGYEKRGAIRWGRSEGLVKNKKGVFVVFRPMVRPESPIMRRFGRPWIHMLGTP